MGTARIRKWRQRLARHARALASAWRYSGELARWHGLGRLRMNVDTYFHYRLFDPELSADAKRRYLSEAPRAQYFSSFGLPLATIYGVFDPEVGRSMEGQSLRTGAELGGFIRRFRLDGFVFKPAEGVQGRAYDAAALVDVARDTAALELQNPRSNVSSFLLEERIRPHPDLAELVGPTLCSVRVVTVVALDGSPRIVGSVYKLQPKPVGVDHLMYGALGCWVDPDTGALGPGRNRAGYEYTSVIPGTDRSFVGYRLPCWNQVKEVVLH
jgi:Sugar-transfer associated ATP-grasp